MLVRQKELVDGRLYVQTDAFGRAEKDWVVVRTDGLAERERLTR